MNGSVVRADRARTWRMRQWPHDPTVAHLIFVDHDRTPSPDDIAAAVDHAAANGARAIRTSALFPNAAEIVLANGFDTIDRLALLQRDLGAPLEAADVARHRVRSLPPWRHRHAAIVDVDAFGPLWGNDTSSLREILRATPDHRARYVARRGGVAGFALSGAAGEHGYLQRVAVSPTARRDGVATALVVDALAWMRDGGRRRCLVNTGLDNDGALALYRQLGFERLADVLTIAEHRLAG